MFSIKVPQGSFMRADRSDLFLETLGNLHLILSFHRLRIAASDLSNVPGDRVRSLVLTKLVPMG